VYIVLKKTQHLKTPINKWNRKTEADKTYNNFKVHFRQAHQEFRETMDIIIKESKLETNQANFVQ
jgi:hypothetical protein